MISTLGVPIICLKKYKHRDYRFYDLYIPLLFYTTR